MGKGAHRGQSCIAAAHCVVAFGFEMGEEVEYQRRIEIAQCQLGGRLAPLSFCIGQPSPLTKPDPDVLIKADPASARQLAGKGVKGTVE